LILERLRRQGIEVILLTIFPPGRVALARRPVWSDKTLDAASAFNRRMLGMNRPGVTVVDCDTVLSDGNRMRPEYALDTLHVNPAGYAALDRLIEPVLARVSAADGTGRK
jgi:lysophospholipase L1-like esterase